MHTRAHYSTLYQRLAVNALEQARNAIEGGVFDHEEREQALHILWHYGFNLPAAWAITSRLLLNLAPHLEQAGYRDDWIPYLHRGVVLSQQQDDLPIEAELAYHLGLLYQLRGKFDESMQWLMHSHDHFAALGDARNQAKTLNRLAYVACLRSNFSVAVGFLEQELALLVEDNYVRQFGFFVQGVIAHETGNLEGAALYFQQSLAICEQQIDKRLIAQRLSSLGFVSYDQGKYTDAIIYCERAIALFDEVHDTIQQAIARMNLGNIYLLLKNFDRAAELYQMAEPTLRTAMDERNLTLLYMNQGILQRELCCWDAASSLLLGAAERWRMLKNTKWEANSLDELGMVYFAQGFYSEARAVFERAHALLRDCQEEPAHQAIFQTVCGHLSDCLERQSVLSG